MRHWNTIRLAIAILAAAACTAATAQTYAEHSLLSSGRWVKIRIDAAGVYQLTTADLRSMGFSNPDQVRLYGTNYEVLPESRIEDIGDDMTELPLFRMGDRMLFYGRGTTRWTLNSVTSTTVNYTHFNNPYSNSVYYFLSDAGEGSPKAFEKFAYEVSASARNQNTFPAHALIESDQYSLLRSGRTFFEEYNFANGRSRNYDLSMPGIVSGSKVTLAVQFGAAGTSPSTLNIAFNGAEIGTLSFSALVEYVYGVVSSRSMSIDAPSGENNTVTLTHERTAGTNGHLDYIRASYMRHLNMTGTQLLFRPATAGDVVFKMTGGTAETVFWHINNAAEIEEVAATYDASNATWTIPFSSSTKTSTAWREEQLLAVNTAASYPTPVNCGQIGNQDLHALKDIDLVVLVPTNKKLITQAQRLADAHAQRDGMRCTVLPVNLIYNEFSAGTPDATAIRRFMKMLYDKADTEANRPKNLLLFGPGLWDNRMVTPSMRGRNPDDYLLTYQSDNSVHLQRSYVLEEYYTLTDNNTTGDVLRWKPRIGVGRIPVHTASEAKTVVNKLLTYINNEQVGNWKNLICLLADDGNNNQHMQDADAVYKDLTAKFPDYRVRRIYWDTYTRVNSSTGAAYPAATADINRQMQEGALVMNYTGHGAAYCLSHEMVLISNDFARWNSPRLPLWITAACDVSPFDMDEENLGEKALLNPRGAAMSLLTTTRTVQAGPNRELVRRFNCNILDTDENGKQYTLGQALAKAKCALIDISSDATNKADFVLLGDPAIRLAIPTYKINIDRINETYAPGTPYTANAGSLLTIEGHIVDKEGNLADSFNGLIYPLIQDNVETVVCNNNQGESTVYTYSDRLRTLYTCADYVKDGKFKFTFPIPLDNNYSGQEGLISLYAVNNEATIEANGRFTNFTVGGTAAGISSDTEGPQMQVYLNTEDFSNGDVVNETPLLIAKLHDDNGLNMTGSGVGHDITAVIDNNPSWTYSLNSYFTPTVGDYRKGSIDFSIPQLSDGQHTLLLRAYDALNNPSTTSIDFFVNTGEAPDVYEMRIQTPVNGITTFTIVTNRPQTDLNISLRVYDITGRILWQGAESGFSFDQSYTFTWDMNESDSHLTPGIYIVRADVSSNKGDSTKIAKKYIVPHSH